MFIYSLLKMNTPVAAWIFTRKTGNLKDIETTDHYSFLMIREIKKIEWLINDFRILENSNGKKKGDITSEYLTEYTVSGDRNRLSRLIGHLGRVGIYIAKPNFLTIFNWTLKGVLR